MASKAGTAKKPTKRATPTATAEASGVRSFTAAARKVDLTTREGRKLVRRLEQWQQDAWTFKRSIGILDRGARFHGNAMSRLRFYAGVIVDPDEEPIPVEDAVDDPEVKFPAQLAEIAANEWGRVANSTSGQSGLQRSWGTLLSVIGDSWLVASPNEDDPALEDWNVYSPSALTVQGERVFVKETPSGSKRELVGDPVAYRIWRQDDEWPGLADSPMRSIFADAEEWLGYSAQLRAIAKSAIPNGWLLVPSELDPPRQPAPDGEGASDPAQQGQPVNVPTEFEQQLMTHILTAIEQEDSAARAAPGVLRGKGEHLDHVKYLAMSRPIDAQILPRLEYLARRLCDGVDLPAAMVLGLEDVNHWTSWMIGDDTYQSYTRPLASIPATGMTAAFLRPAVRAHSEIPEAVLREWLPKIAIGIDPTALVARPNRSADALAVFAEGGLSWAALRKHHGFPETEAPTDEELDKRAIYGFTRPKNPNATATAVADSGGAATPSTGVAGSARLTALPTLTAAATPRNTGLGPTFAQIEGRLRERLLAACSSAVNDALRKAGNRLRSKAQNDATLRASVNGLPADRVGRVLGLQAAATLVNPDELLDGAFDNLAGQYDRYTARAQASVAKALGPFATTDEAQRALDDYEAQQDRRRDLGWSVLALSLMALARERLFAEEQTPTDSVLDVPMGLIGQALSVVGGLDAGNVPSVTGKPGGLTGGTEVGGVLEASSLAVEGWVWVHGDPTTPFEPHLDLDGFAFTDFQQDELVNNESWPDFPFLFPGDHEACSCVTLSAIVSAEGDVIGEVPSDTTTEAVA
jgi:hypothetical protein